MQNIRVLNYFISEIKCQRHQLFKISVKLLEFLSLWKLEIVVQESISVLIENVVILHFLFDLMES